MLEHAVVKLRSRQVFPFLALLVFIEYIEALQRIFKRIGNAGTAGHKTCEDHADCRCLKDFAPCRAAFAAGTYELLRATSKVPFSVIGGGHTAAVIERMGIEKEFTHVSTGGGACIEFLTGKKLPALDALERSKKLFGL
jgi:hypothetical protein